MKKKVTVTALVTTLVFAGASSQVFASDVELHQIKDQVQLLSQQNQKLMERIAELEKNEQPVFADSKSVDAEENDMLSYINDHVDFGGAIEVEAGWSEDFDGTSESSIDLATAEFAFEAEVTDWALGVMAIEWDGDEDKLTVDEAFINFGGTDAFPVYFKGGRYVVPFGAFDGNTITDPLTKEAFEAKEDAVTLGNAFGPITVDAFIYNGETNEGGGDSNIEQFGGALGYAFENDSISMEAHVGYSNSIVDSDGLQEELDLEADYVGGVALQGSLRAAGAVLIAEYITAVEDYESTDELTGEVLSAQPSAYQLEAGYNFNLGTLPALVTLGYSGSSDLGGVLPETRLMAVLGVELSDGIGINLEYARDTDYDEDDGGTGEEADSVIAQLYYEF